MNRARNEKCSRRRRSGGGGRGGGARDAPIWVTREGTYVAGREDRAICRARPRPGEGGRARGGEGERVKHRKDVTGRRRWGEGGVEGAREINAREGASFTIPRRRRRRRGGEGGGRRSLFGRVYCRRRRAPARPSARPSVAAPALAHAKARMRNGVAFRVRNCAS